MLNVNVLVLCHLFIGSDAGGVLDGVWSVRFLLVGASAHFE